MPKKFSMSADARRRRASALARLEKQLSAIKQHNKDVTADYQRPTSRIEAEIETIKGRL